MRLHGKEQGGIGTVITFVLMGLLVVGGAAFGFWAFSERDKYKNDTDKLIAEAVEVAKEEQKAADTADFTEKEKLPYEVYKGPGEFGGINIQYPKTWELYVDINTRNTTNPVKGYAHPVFVPGVQSDTAFALRFEIVGSDYAELIKRSESNVKSGATTVKPFRAPKVPSVLGARLNGKLPNNEEGSMVLLPVRDKTLQIWTESQAYVKDFEEIIKQISFSP